MTFRAMIPHVRNDSRAGLGVLGGGTFGHGGSGNGLGRNGGPVTEMSATIEVLFPFTTPGANFINVLRAAFTHADSQGVSLFCAFGICVRKSCS